MPWTDVSFNYENTHVLVTGGTSGIGAGIAAAYIEAGAHVTITGTRARASDYGPHLESAGYLQLDLEDDEQTARIANTLPALDILVHNAGAHLEADNEYLPEIFSRSVKLNLINAWRLAQACHPLLAKSQRPGGASLIGLASLSSFRGSTGIPGYGAAKAGIVQMTKTLAMHWASDHVRVNAVAPGLILSNMTADLFNSPELGRQILEKTPLARTGIPVDIAGAVLFLTSQAASFITGQTLVVDGGYALPI